MANILRVSVMGSLPSGEVWSVNPCFRIGIDQGEAYTNAQAQTAANAIAALAVPTGILNTLSSETRVTGCRVEARSFAGILESQAEGVKAVPAAGGGNSPHSFQTAIVLSLRSATPGASGRGRLYWPATGQALSTTSLRVATASVTSILSGFKTYLSGIQSALDVGVSNEISLTVWSRKNLMGYSVQSLHMGDITDVQRRRRDQTIESYQTTAWP